MKKLYYSFFILILSMVFIPSSVIAESDAIEVELHIKDHKFIPAVLELPTGKKINLTIYNDDETIEEFESPDLKRERIVPGKSDIKIILAPLKPGEYKFFGEFYQKTAQGKIIIKE